MVSGKTMSTQEAQVSGKKGQENKIRSVARSSYLLSFSDEARQLPIIDHSSWPDLLKNAPHRHHWKRNSVLSAPSIASMSSRTNGKDHQQLL